MKEKIKDIRQQTKAQLDRIPWEKVSWMKKYNPFRFIKRLDWYIINKFIGTYFYSIILIISISIVFDVNENLAKFTNNQAPLRAIVFDYYTNFVPYFANLFSPLFVFIAVIFFTSKLAGNSEIISMLACGMSFKRLLRPYLISAAFIATLNFYLGAYIIPKGTVVRHDFEALYKNNKKNTSASNIQIMVDKGVVAYISQYDDIRKTGYGFALYKFENKKMVSQMNANVIQYDTISDSRYHWKARNYKIRTLKGMREQITSGVEIDTLIQMEPMDLVFSRGQQETFTSPELLRYISKQQQRGSSNVVQYEVEYHKRIASSFASFILTIIGVSLSSRKRKGGMGMYLGIGLALSFTYILLQTVCATFAINADTPPMLAAWIPNILYSIIAYFCYRQAPD
ncbi:MAG: YjgP/YjgQ family permease [Prevotella sp.]|jgi:lipopolysaccharide export system permease protein|nr:YjgP/YjgQ family permease [Prevotella sp.]MBQ2674000.1 LptF/LptG family permease [Prevotella sp.]MBQ3361462.1 LptF/LptG family permease [Prevotella sp.]MBR1412433.1 LptF/LptG family permease [Prevotella sp.]